MVTEKGGAQGGAVPCGSEPGHSDTTRFRVRHVLIQHT